MMVKPSLEREYTRAGSDSSLRPLEAENQLAEALFFAPASSLAISQRLPLLSMSALGRQFPVYGVSSVARPT